MSFVDLAVQLSSAYQLLGLVLLLLKDAIRFVSLLFKSHAALAALVLFHEKQLGAFVEKAVKPRRLDNAGRMVMACTSMLFEWKHSLVVVKPATLLAWHENLRRLFWTWISRRRKSGRPPIPENLQQLIRTMARENPTWGEERIASELSLKLGRKVSPRTISAYWPPDVPRPPRSKHVSTQRWAIFVRNHIRQIVACDFVTISLYRFQILYAFVVIDLGSRRVLHVNVTRHPTAAWTMQQLREAIPVEHNLRFLIHDRDKIFSAEVDRAAKNLGLRVLKTPPRAPKANAYCERVIGTPRRECLRFFIALNERGVRQILREWVSYYNHARPHSALGPGIPEPASGLPATDDGHRHTLPEGSRVTKQSVLGGLHHDYRLEDNTAA